MQGRWDSHVLVITSVGILVIRGDDELLALLDREVLVVGSVAGTDLRTFLRGGQIGKMMAKKVGRLTVSRAIARGRPFWTFSASRELSITDWWYYAGSVELVGAYRGR